MLDTGSPGWQIGPLLLPASVLTTWGIIAVLTLACVGIGRRLVDTPGLVQTAVEGILIAMESAIAAVLPDQARTVLPFVGTLWTFLAVANLAGLIPGLHSPTADLSVTAALAVLVYLSVHWFGIREAGLKDYLRHYVSPNPVLLPFHLLGELTRTVALAVRLFGNIMSLEIAALIMLLAAGFLVPVPILMLHIIEALVQAYIFGMLALMYIASGLHVQQQREPSQNPTSSE